MSVNFDDIADTITSFLIYAICSKLVQEYYAQWYIIKVMQAVWIVQFWKESIVKDIIKDNITLTGVSKCSRTWLYVIYIYICVSSFISD